MKKRLLTAVLALTGLTTGLVAETMRPIVVTIENKSDVELSFSYYNPKNDSPECMNSVIVQSGEKKVLFEGNTDWDTGEMEICSEILQLDQASHSSPTKKNLLAIFTEGTVLHRFKAGDEKKEIWLETKTSFGPGEKPTNTKHYTIVANTHPVKAAVDYLFHELGL